MVTELLLAGFTLIFFLHSGARHLTFLLGTAPAEARTQVDVAGRRGLAALVRYIRATAVVDAVATGSGLAAFRYSGASSTGKHPSKYRANSADALEQSALASAITEALVLQMRN